MNEVVKEAKTYIDKWFNEEIRVAPLMLSRLARGGKTRTLYEIFEMLKKSGTNVMLISFSPDTKYCTNPGESHKHILMRLIAS